ncbi:MAG: hypothetical protein QM736_26280 [Vicinamibacterales bacterium]
MEITLGRARSAHDVGEGWTTADATELYEIARWGRDYFSIGDNGQVQVHPSKDPRRSINLKQLVDDLQRRGISLPDRSSASATSSSTASRTSTTPSSPPSPRTSTRGDTSASIRSR